MSTPEQFLQQAREFHQQGQMQTALDLYRSAVKAAPRSVDAQTALGLALTQIGRDAEAIEHLDRAIKLDPTNPELLCNLGMAHRSQGRLGEALTCFERAVWMSKKFPRAVAGAAEVLALQGEYGRSHAMLMPYVASNEDQAAIALTYARCCRALDKGTDAGPALTRHLVGQKGEVAPMTRVYMLLELANILDGSGHHEQAFSAATDANRVLERRFNADRYNEEIDATIKNWTQEVHAEIPQSSNESEAPVLVVGMPRSGQALVEQILASHAEIAPAGETAISRHLITQLDGVPSPDVMPYSRPQPLNFQSVNEGAAFCVNTLSMITRRDGYEQPARIVDRCTHNYLYLGMLDRMLPNARVIHVRRNPLDTALSCYMNHFDIPYHFKIHLADFAQAYLAYQRIMDHWKSVIGIRVLEVDYEDVVSDLEGQSRRMIEFLGLEWDASCLRFWETPRRMVPFANIGTKKPIYTTSVGRHANYEQFVAPLRGALGMPPADPPAESQASDGSGENA